jgi:hypothetical protein
MNTSRTLLYKSHLILLGFLFGSLASAQDTSKSEFLKQWQSTFSVQASLVKYELYREIEPMFLEGDFFGDGVLDLVFFIADSSGSVKLCFANKGQQLQIKIVGDGTDSLHLDDYSFAGDFRKVEAGEALWSNYLEPEGMRNFEEVKDREKVFLDYNALFMHTLEACGGGFVYWNKGKFHWLQQE